MSIETATILAEAVNALASAVTTAGAAICGGLIVNALFRK